MAASRSVKYDYNYSKLKGRLREKGLTYMAFATMLGISVASVCSKLNNQAQFTQGEIEGTMKGLELDPHSVDLYFFAH